MTASALATEGLNYVSSSAPLCELRVLVHCHTLNLVVQKLQATAGIPARPDQPSAAHLAADPSGALWSALIHCVSSRLSGSTVWKLEAMTHTNN